MHPLIAFWKKAYPQYEISDGRFFNPLFPDPLMSPNFAAGSGHFNLIHSAETPATEFGDLDVLKPFYLGHLKISTTQVDISCEIIPLSKAIKLFEYWDLLRDGFPRDFSFLEKLIPFLSTQKTPYFVGLLKEDNDVIAMVTMGVEDNMAILVNAVVKSSRRGQNYSQKLHSLVQMMGQQYQCKIVLFWTLIPGLIKYFDHVERYSIVQTRLSQRETINPATFSKGEKNETAY
jgi:hypothetical protein